MSKELEVLSKLAKEYLVPGIARMLHRELGKINQYKLDIEDVNKKIESLKTEISSLRSDVYILNSKTSEELVKKLFGDLFED